MSSGLKQYEFTLLCSREQMSTLNFSGRAKIKVKARLASPRSSKTVVLNPQPVSCDPHRSHTSEFTLQFITVAKLQ